MTLLCHDHNEMLPRFPGVLTIDGKDETLRSELCSARTDSLHFRAPADRRRYALYGPYLPLPAGCYKFDLFARIGQKYGESVRVDLCHKKGGLILYSRPCFSWELGAERIHISYSLLTDIDDFEFRLSVSMGVSGSIYRLVIRRHADLSNER
jgi:hypothetical protein